MNVEKNSPMEVSGYRPAQANSAAATQWVQISDDCHIEHEESQENCPDLL